MPTNSAADELFLKSLTPDEEPKASTPQAEEPEPEIEFGGEEDIPQRETKQENLPSEEVKDDSQESDSQKADAEEDEYGNPMPKAKTYTEEEVNQRINQAVRDRIARMERNNQPQATQQQVQQAAKGFEYDADSNEDWQQQLDKYIDNRLDMRASQQAQRLFQEKEQRAQAEFEAKFRRGMEKFGDFEQTVQDLPFSDAMVIATRAMSDPAAFMYAAAKRMPEEVKRIANISDQYVQMVEIGKLEERLKKGREATRAPRPAAKVSEDSAMPQAKKKDKGNENDIDALIHEANIKRKSWMANRGRK